jgi:hypothetical protein
MLEQEEKEEEREETSKKRALMRMSEGKCKGTRDKPGKMRPEVHFMKKDSYMSEFKRRGVRRDLNNTRKDQTNRHRSHAGGAKLRGGEFENREKRNENGRSRIRKRVETDSCGKYSFKYGRVLGMLSRGH